MFKMIMKTAEEILGNFEIGVNIEFGRYEFLYEILKKMVEHTQKEAYNQALEDAIALRKRIGNPYNEREGKDMLNFEIEARKLKK